MSLIKVVSRARSIILFGYECRRLIVDWKWSWRNQLRRSVGICEW